MHTPGRLIRGSRSFSLLLGCSFALALSVVALTLSSCCTRYGYPVGCVVVQNETHETVEVFIARRFVGELPGGTRETYKGIRAGPLILEARGAAGRVWTEPKGAELPAEGIYVWRIR